MQNDQTDKQLKALMRGQAAAAGPFVWAENSNTGQPLQPAHAVLGLETGNAALADHLALFQSLLLAYGYMSERPTAQAAGEFPRSFDWRELVDEVVPVLRRDTTLVARMSRAGRLPDFNQARTNAARLAAILDSLT